MLVPGLLGGPDGVPAPPFDKLLLIGGGAPLPGGGFPFPPIASPFPWRMGESEPLDGGPTADPGCGVEVGPGAPDAVLRGPVAFGGGGVADGVGVLSAPAFLLTQRFNSGS